VPCASLTCDEALLLKMPRLVAGKAPKRTLLTNGKRTVKTAVALLIRRGREFCIFCF